MNLQGFHNSGGSCNGIGEGQGNIPGGLHSYRGLSFSCGNKRVFERGIARSGGVFQAPTPSVWGNSGHSGIFSGAFFALDMHGALSSYRVGANWSNFRPIVESAGARVRRNKPKLVQCRPCRHALSAALAWRINRRTARRVARRSSELSSNKIQLQALQKRGPCWACQRCPNRQPVKELDVRR